MPQIMVDTDTESPVSLRMLADLLSSYAKLKEIEEAQGASTMTALAAATHQQPVVTGPTTAPFTPDLPQGDETTQAFNPAEIFAKDGIVPTGTVPVAPIGPTLPGNVLPFPSLQAPPTQMPVTPAAQLPVTGMPAFVPVAGNQLTLPATGAVGTAVELDSAGLPWDARIHQASRGRNEKGTGTWKVLKGLETKSPGLLQQVMAELMAAKTNGVTGALAAAAVVVPPVTLPAPLSMPQPIVGPTTGPLVFPTMPPASPGASLPPVSNGLPPVHPAAVGVPSNPMVLFQALMGKIGAALNATPPLITQEQVNAAHTNLNVPQLQLLITRPELIPQVEAALGL